MFDTGGYATDSSLADLVKEGILQMCFQLKPEAVAVADSLAPPDFVLNSVIGKSDGKVRTVETLQCRFIGISRSACSLQKLGLALSFINLKEQITCTVLAVS
jgi:acyl-CoA oxidase